MEIEPIDFRFDDLEEDIKKLPNIHRSSIIQYLAYYKYCIIRDSVALTNEPKDIIFRNWAMTVLNTLINVFTKVKEWGEKYSMLNREKIKNEIPKPDKVLL